MKSFVFAMTLVSAVFAQAALLTFEPGNLQIEGTVLSKTATVNDSTGKPVATLGMDLLGAGLRSKTVLFVAAKVYVLELFSDNKAAYSRNDQALNSIVQNSKMVALKISMKRTVSAETLATSFREAIEANNITVDAELTTLLNLIEQSADGTDKGTISLLMKKADGKLNVYYEDTKGQLKSFTGTESVMGKILAIWLGKPADSGLEKLKAQLLNPVY